MSPERISQGSDYASQRINEMNMMLMKEAGKFPGGESRPNVKITNMPIYERADLEIKAK